MTTTVDNTATTETATVTMEQIGNLCRSYAEARDRLAETGEVIRDERRAAVRRRMATLKRRVAEVSAARDELAAAVSAAPGLFERPRTRAIEGIKVGYRKMPGKIEIADEARAIDRVRTVMPDREADLVQTRETLRRSALKTLDAKALARIGVTVVDVDDEVVIAAAADDLDRLVDVLMADGEEAA